MCLQCETDSVWIAEFAPGWHLVQAQDDSFDGEWLSGEYGIVRANDPHFIVPKLKWFDAITDDNLIEYIELTRDFYDQSMIDIESGHSLFNALSSVEYPDDLKQFWDRECVDTFIERFYTYLAWLAKEHHD